MAEPSTRAAASGMADPQTEAGPRGWPPETQGSPYRPICPVGTRVVPHEHGGSPRGCHGERPPYLAPRRDRMPTGGSTSR